MVGMGYDAKLEHAQTRGRREAGNAPAVLVLGARPVRINATMEGPLDIYATEDP